uniref:Ig-like domain-containing protein n=1 Tax=Gopherus evgoodei TaxID=1825980 RepID=A0A8C4WBQ0_9SAUR
MGKARVYMCAYWILRSGRHILSERSQPVSLSMQAPPEAPSLSLSPPHPVYLPGESVTLTCSPPPGAPVAAEFQFSRDGGRKISSRSSDVHALSITGPEDSGSYTCVYWIRPSGRKIQSPGSRPVSIAVTAPPPAPRLSLDTPNTVYLAGERLNLSCSAPGAQEVTGYRFYKRPPEQSSEELPSPQGGPQLEILAAVGDEGSYTCQYWSRESGRELPSGLSQPITIRVTERPSAPQLALAPPHPVYVLGEWVTLRCSAPQGEGVTRYRFYRQRRGLIADGVPEPAGGAQLELRAEMGMAGLYVCAYWTLRAGREVPSGESRPISVSVIELIQGREVPSCASDAVSVSVFPAPAAPSLLLIPPLPLYVTGETVTAECIVPAGLYVPRAHWVLRDGEALREQPEPQLPLNVTRRDSGTYRCGYSTELHGRHLRSPPSDPVTLSMTDPPPQPALSVDPPSRAVSEGLPLLITCMAPWDASERRFHFYKDGAELPSGDTGSEISTTEPSIGSVNFSVLSILRASPSNTGEFSCGYELNMSGRWIPSPRSQAVNVTVRAWSLPIPLVAGCSGAATALALLLLLLICLCRKKVAGA